MNPYQRFFKKERCKLLGLEGEFFFSHGKISVTDLSKPVSAKWRNISITEKQKYQDEFKNLNIYRTEGGIRVQNASQNSASKDETDEMDRNLDSLETQKEIRKR